MDNEPLVFVGIVANLSVQMLDGAGSETEESEATAPLPRAPALERYSPEGLAAISDLLVTLPWMAELHSCLRFCGSAD